MEICMVKGILDGCFGASFKVGEVDNSIRSDSSLCKKIFYTPLHGGFVDVHIFKNVAETVVITKIDPEQTSQEFKHEGKGWQTFFMPIETLTRIAVDAGSENFYGRIEHREGDDSAPTVDEKPVADPEAFKPLPTYADDEVELFSMDILSVSVPKIRAALSKKDAYSLEHLQALLAYEKRIGKRVTGIDAIEDAIKRLS